MIVTIEEARAFIAKLNLSGPTNVIFMDGTMSPHTLGTAVVAYRQFLLTVWQCELDFRSNQSVCTDIDPGILAEDVWRAHILHTREYHEMCAQLFGKFLHYTPKTGGACDTTIIKNTERVDTMVPLDYRFTPYPHPWFEMMPRHAPTLKQ